MSLYNYCFHLEFCGKFFLSMNNFYSFITLEPTRVLLFILRIICSSCRWWIMLLGMDKIRKNDTCLKKLFGTIYKMKAIWLELRYAQLCWTFDLKLLVKLIVIILRLKSAFSLHSFKQKINKAYKPIKLLLITCHIISIS